MRTLRIVVIVTVAACWIPQPTMPSPPGDHARPNVVVIITDDQRFHSLFAMPHVQALMARGVTLSRGIVSNSLCCPSRASILTGAYSHTTKVYTNVYVPWSPYGGWREFQEAGDERGTIALTLHRAGYRTALFGKYLNDFTGRVVPPGWDRFAAFFGDHAYGAYFGYRMLVGDQGGARVEDFGSTVRDYSTTVIADKAMGFLRATPETAPFFLYVAPFAPHTAAVPAPTDVGTWAAYEQQLPPSFNEQDVSDKPPYIRGSPFREETVMRLHFELEYETLQAVDRMVGQIVDELRRSGRLHDTLIVFMSDNGEEFGEHRWDYKLTPYEESIRVPIVVRYDPLTRARAGSVLRTLVASIDLAPTIADIAGVRFEGVGTVDGASMVPLMGGTAKSIRPSVLLEHIDYPGAYHVPSYCGIRTSGWLYVRYQDGFVELYRLWTDPFELTNIAATASGPRDRLRAETHALCRPLPPGYHWS
ncbi:MAG: sulfatase family protein [Actinomycetota bacterium]